jgi:2-keto-4-pentenoate hydratase/2-oxohepta-3-ene-1,7-dioic acid hydratase in catechol pathway
MPYRLANIDGRAALATESHYYDLETISGGSVGSDPMAALAHPDELVRLSGTLAAATPTGSLADAKLEAPVPRPRNSFGIGLNYRNHAAEADMELPAKPMVFTKFPSCIVGPHATVELRSDRVDYEGELVVVIGAPGKDIPRERAWEHVAGLTVGQDISDRPAQFMAKPPHFALGKSFDTFGPLGPVLVSTDSFDDPGDLLLQTFVNGDKRQEARTSDLIFDVPFLVSFLSHITRLATGDVIFTGTPEGVGFKNQQWLADGDLITTTIEGIGSLNNPCARVSDWKER